MYASLLHAILVSFSTQGIDATMVPQGMTHEEIEEFVARIVKEQKGRVMSRLRDRVSHPFTRVSPHVQNLRIDSYRG